MKEKELLERADTRLGITSLNAMQTEMLRASSEHKEIVLLAPTGSGKTLAFTLPMLKTLKPSCGRIQALVIEPTRELARQTADVVRTLASGYKVSVLYGGHSMEEEVNTLSVVPDVVVATPGRLVDHLKRRTLSLAGVRNVVIDEFDKQLELGFEDQMRRLCRATSEATRRALTSATGLAELPEYLLMTSPHIIDYTRDAAEVRGRMNILRVDSPERDKLATLLELLHTLAAKEGIGSRTIVFVNYRSSADRVAVWLEKHGVRCALYHGALEQRDREMQLATFDNGSRRVLVSTDLASRGLDITGVENVVHYNLPPSAEVWTHRNGRTARQDARGSVYVITGPGEALPEFIRTDGVMPTDSGAGASLDSGLATICISGGKKDKVSRRDVLGFLTAQGGLEGSDVGRINLYDRYSLAAVPAEGVTELAERLSRLKIKGERRRVTVV